MNSEAKKTLIKDLVILGVMLVIGLSLLNTTPLGLFCIGLPFGWKWASNIISAVSFNGLVAKFLFSVALGLIAIPVVLVKDIIAVIIEAKSSTGN